MIRTERNLFVFERGTRSKPRSSKFYDLAADPKAEQDLTGRGDQVPLVEAYCKAQGLWRDDAVDRIYSDTIEFDIVNDNKLIVVGMLLLDCGIVAISSGNSLQVTKNTPQIGVLRGQGLGNRFRLVSLLQRSHGRADSVNEFAPNTAEILLAGIAFVRLVSAQI